MKKTLGGDRLGSGKKMQVELHGYERSSHDLSYIFRSTMSAGTLVPFMSKVALPGDTWDINLNADVKTLPTVGPLFGGYKVQLDVFLAPIRLYNAYLMSNKIGIGLEMNKIKFPVLQLEASKDINEQDPDNSHINPSSIFAYLGIRGLGRPNGAVPEIKREFNAIPYLVYWDVYKQYYANKQEEIGAVIHSEGFVTGVTQIELNSAGQNYIIASGNTNPVQNVSFEVTDNPEILITASQEPDPQTLLLYTTGNPAGTPISAIFTNFVWNSTTGILYSNTPVITGGVWSITGNGRPTPTTPLVLMPKVRTFPLENIDKMREDIQAEIFSFNAFTINHTSRIPYSWPCEKYGTVYAKMQSQEGLAVKTYQSDIFNNWLSTDWIDGTNGINEITAIDTSGGSFNIDTFNLAKKVYEMLNRIAVSGGTYEDWLDAVYTNDRARQIVTPMYMGGLIKELVFQEVVSNAQSEMGGEEQSLGTLAGKGVMGNKHKGGNIRIRVDEPSYILGIVSLTPRIDYSQGNDWDVNLKTIDELHKPALDQIGFQDAITDQFAWFDTLQDNVFGNPVFKSAGKQPAWLNYMTATNKVLGNFAIEDNSMFMTLNRKYEYSPTLGIKDLTTYIDPVKFNHIFAQTSRDAQNFWVQISSDITARRKMSAKIMPNL